MEGAFGPVNAPSGAGLAGSALSILDIPPTSKKVEGFSKAPLGQFRASASTLEVLAW